MRLIYLLPTHDSKPSGGVKVIYQHADILHKMGIETYVLHLFKPNFSCNWFEHNAININIPLFDISTDFLIIPEVIAGELGAFCLQNNLKYGIFVQNGFLIQKGLSEKSNNDLFEVYKNAEIILSISKEVDKLLQFIFSFQNSNKIVKVRPYIKDLSTSVQKSFLISYMSRKLNNHSKNILFILKNKINKKWKFINIDNYSEVDTFKLLNKSRIFLSFSDQEGLGLPPIEAALCNNFIIGYTGTGGDEYFNFPLFSKIDYGDIVSFVNEIILVCKNIEKKMDFHKNLNCKKQRNRLLSFFSLNEVEKDLANFYQLLKLVKFEQNSHQVRFSSSPISKLIRYFK